MKELEFAPRIEKGAPTIIFNIVLSTPLDHDLLMQHLANSYLKNDRCMSGFLILHMEWGITETIPVRDIIAWLERENNLVQASDSFLIGPGTDILRLSYDLEAFMVQVTGFEYLPIYVPDQEKDRLFLGQVPS